MGIFCTIKVESSIDENETIEFEAMVDTSATWLTLPAEWRQKFNSLGPGREANFWRPDKPIIVGEVCGPVKILIEGFKPSFGEVMFVDLEPREGILRPLVGSLQLESSMALLDRVNRRLKPMAKLPLE
jgi:hypothetical protein